MCSHASRMGRGWGNDPRKEPKRTAVTVRCYDSVDRGYYGATTEKTDEGRFRFCCEKALVDRFVDSLTGSPSPWGAVQVAREFFYQRGRTDVVALAANG